MLTKYIGQKKSKGEKFLEEHVHAYSTASHESSHCRPYELMFARKSFLDKAEMKRAIYC